MKRRSSVLASAEQLKRIVARRGPFTDPREGRVIKLIHRAFETLEVDVLSTSVLQEWAFGARCIRKLAGFPSWHRQSIKLSASKICTPIGRATGEGAGSGCPQLWRIDPERAKVRSRQGR